MTKAVVLFSGGQDSTTCLYWAKHRLGADVEVHALSVYYGQRHAAELDAAFRIAHMADVASHVSVDLGTIMTGGESALLAANFNDEIKAEGGIVDREMPQGLPTSFVPGRNLMLLALAVARAGALGAQHIVTGVCQTDYSGYPDCRENFIRSMQSAIMQAWPTGVREPQIHTPLMDRTKAETVVLASNLPGCLDALALSVTCYHGKRPGCGTCPACLLRARGFQEAGIADPAEVP
jgi:7-cyano-7-deazaguanine synthase